ncbi:MAG: hypothetical protein J7K00_01255 [Candidatus Diapherotrites archaeon]|nr:hypothetical protein [Candidatus Diapherotrites archaeon]
MAGENDTGSDYVSGSIKFSSDVEKERIKEEKSRQTKKTLKKISLVLVVVFVLALAGGVIYLFATDSPVLDFIDFVLDGKKDLNGESERCTSPECFLPALKQCTSGFTYSFVSEQGNFSESARILSKTNDLCKVSVLVEDNGKKFKGLCFFPDEFKPYKVKADPASMELICKSRFSYFFSPEKSA